MQMRKLLLVTILILSVQVIFGQSCEKILNQAKASYQKGDLRLALEQLQYAEICDYNDELQKERQGLQQQIFDAVEQAKVTAEKTLEQLVLEQEKTNQALESEKAAKLTSDSLFVIAVKSDSITKIALAETETARKRADSLFQKADKLVNAFYFYEDRLALAYKNDHFGFIDREGELVIEYLYDKAQQFDESGFAKVSKFYDPIEDEPEFINYLIDTTGKRYQVIYDKTSLIHFGYMILPRSAQRIIKKNNRESEFSVKMTEDVVALDYRKYFQNRFPKSILKHQQLQVLLLDGQRLRTNEFTTLPSKIEQLENLEVLSVSYCQLRTLPDKIEGLTRLKKLNLGYNQLSELPLGIAEIDSLEHLDINSNSFDSFPIIVSQLKRLISLRATGNRFKNLPDSLGGLTALKYLNLSDNDLTQLPLSFKHLTALEELNLNANFIQEISFPIDSLLSLRKLDLRFNLLDSLPVEIGKLYNLKILDLDGQLLRWSLNHYELALDNVDVKHGINSYTLLLSIANAFAEFPKNIILSNAKERPFLGNASDLTIYIEQMNSAFYSTVLPPEIGRLKKLVKIELRNTKLRSLPKEVGELENLILLDLSGNKLDSLPSEIGKLKKLEELLLGSNNIDSLPSNIGGLENLTVLDLSNNSLASIPNEIGSLKNLQELSLRGNPIPPSEQDQLHKLLPNCLIRF